MPKEYIEREALLKDISETVIFSGKTDQISVEVRAANKVITRIKEAPATDVVEVVRCKDCKWAMSLTETEEKIYTNDCIMCSQLHPDGERIAMLRNNFCNYGERNDDAE